MNRLFFFLIVILQFAHSSTFGQCAYKIEEKSIKSMVSYLDCIGKADPLTKLGAYWILLKKAGLRLNHDPLLEANENKLIVSDDLFGNTPGHQLDFNIDLIETENNFNNFLINLETKFSNIIFRKNSNNQSMYLSLVSTFRKNTLLATLEKPLRNYHRYQEKSSTIKRAKTRRALSSFKKTFARIENKYSWYDQIGRNDFLQGRDFDELWKVYAELSPCHSDCTERMYSKAIRGFLMTLSHHELAKGYVNFRKRLTEMESGKKLTYGCFSSHGSKFNRSLLRKVKYLDGESEISFGKNSLPGLTIYIDALYKDELEKENYTGMNGVLRSISDAAFRDLESLKSFGIAKPALLEDELDLEVFKQGVSKIIISYWEARDQGMEKIEAREKFLDRPFFNETIFEPIPLDTGISAILKLFKNASLAKWIETLYKVNPGTPYQFLGYDFFTKSQVRDLFTSVRKMFPSIAEVNEFKIRKRKNKGKSTRYELKEVLHTIF